MAGQVPIVLPEDFFSQWTKPEAASYHGENPFNDSKAGSRVTASGFTDSTVGPSSLPTVQQAEENLRDELTRMENPSNSSREPKNPRVGSGRRDERSDFRGKQVKLGSPIAGMARLSLEDDFIEPLKTSEERAWEAEGKEKYVTLEDFKRFAASLSREPSLAPSNSASNSPFGFASTHSAIVNPRRMNLSRINEDMGSSLDEVDETVVGGYDMTPAQKMRELDSYASIRPVRGLPKMFTSERLNFLTHVHSALFQVLSDENGNYPSNDSLKILLDPKTTWRNDPSTALLELVIETTVDQKTGVVKANPFRLPIIEVTMELTPKLMYMALDQLHREFEIEWFNVMKFVTTPKFQSKYDKIRFKGDSRHRNAESSHRRKSSSSSGRSTSRRSSPSDTGSLLGSVFSRH